MLVISKSDTTANIIVTLNDSITLEAPYYLFVFTNITTKEFVKTIINSTSDLSSYQSRYNEFEINASTLFSGKKKGQWLYKIYEQDNDSNLDPTGLTLIENGKLLLTETTNFAFTGYAASTTYKGYAG